MLPLSSTLLSCAEKIKKKEKERKDVASTMGW